MASPASYQVHVHGTQSLAGTGELAFIHPGKRSTAFIETIYMLKKLGYGSISALNPCFLCREWGHQERPLCSASKRWVPIPSCGVLCCWPLLARLPSRQRWVCTLLKLEGTFAHPRGFTRAQYRNMVSYTSRPTMVPC